MQPVGRVGWGTGFWGVETAITEGIAVRWVDVGRGVLMGWRIVIRSVEPIEFEPIQVDVKADSDVCVEADSNSTLIPRPLEELYSCSLCAPQVRVAEPCGWDNPVMDCGLIKWEWEVWDVAGVSRIDGRGVAEAVGVEGQDGRLLRRRDGRLRG